jgi:hypothetical protein
MTLWDFVARQLARQGLALFLGTEEPLLLRAPSDRSPYSITRKR